MRKTKLPRVTSKYDKRYRMHLFRIFRGITIFCLCASAYLLFCNILFLAIGEPIDMTIIDGKEYSDDLLGAAAYLALAIPFFLLAIYEYARKDELKKKGKRYIGKIYRTSTFSNLYTVRFMDTSASIRETAPFIFANNRQIEGLTVDVYEYRGDLVIDYESIRAENVPEEDTIMERIPVAPDLRKLVAIKCPNCGVTFQAVAGYANRCPYCDGRILA